MTERRERQAEPDLDELRRAWKRTRAPSGLTTKIMATVGEPSSRLPSRDVRWFAAAAVVVVAVIVAVLAQRPVEPAGPVVSLPVPSLAAINQAAGGKPHLSIPGPGNLKSLPARPGIPVDPRRRTPEPTTSTDEEYSDEISYQTRIA